MTTSEQSTDRIRLVPAATTDAVQPPAAPADGRTVPPTTVDVPSVSVVVPTRNERDNIEPLLLRLHAALEGTTAEVIFVDDSDDDTPETVGRMSRHYRGTTTTVSLLHRPSEERAGGLSGAVMDGFRAARARWVVVMDAE